MEIDDQIFAIQLRPELLLDEMLTQALGRSWADEGKQLASRVPSVIIPIEENVLINPRHPAFASLNWERPMHFEFDRRLLKHA